MRDISSDGRSKLESGSGPTEALRESLGPPLPDPVSSAANTYASSSSVPSYPATKILVVLNVMAFTFTALAEQMWPEWDQLRWANWGPFTLSGEWWRLLTSLFIHIRISHLLANVAFLWVLGKYAENKFGRQNFLSLYFGCGLLGSITSLFFVPEAVVCGASSAILGIEGALIVAYAPGWPAFNRVQRWQFTLLLLLPVFAFLPWNPLIDNSGHVAGFLFGLVLGALLTRANVRKTLRLAVFCGLLLILLLGAASATYFSGYVGGLAPAIKALKRGQPDNVLRNVDPVLQKKAGSVLANDLAAQAYLDKKDYAAAVVNARKAYAGDGNDPLTTFIFATALLHTGACEEARSLAIRHLDERERYRDTIELLAEDCKLDLTK